MKNKATSFISPTSFLFLFFTELLLSPVGVMNTGTVHYSTIGIFHSFKRPLQLLCAVAQACMCSMFHISNMHTILRTLEKGAGMNKCGCCCCRPVTMCAHLKSFETRPHACELLLNFNGVSGQAWCLCTGCK